MKYIIILLFCCGCMTAETADTAKKVVDETKAVVEQVAPPPWNWIIGSVLGIVSVALGTYAESRRRTKNVTISSVVKGVERANNPETKKAIQSAARESGVGGFLETKVAELT